jgi:Uma2 family endonuclease
MTVLNLGPGAAGLGLSAADFDAAEYERGWRYELIHGVLVVNPSPLPAERGPNQLLGNLLWQYQQTHENGSSLDHTLPEHDIQIADDRRRADRVIWTGMRRQPKIDDLPTIVVEFVSAGKQDLLRDYETKRDEYLRIGIREYWVFNRFERNLTVFRPNAEPGKFDSGQSYETPLLPGFRLPLAEIFAEADRWAGE